MTRSQYNHMDGNDDGSSISDPESRDAEQRLSFNSIKRTINSDHNLTSNTESRNEEQPPFNSVNRNFQGSIFGFNKRHRADQKSSYMLKDRNELQGTMFNSENQDKNKTSLIYLNTDSEHNLP